MRSFSCFEKLGVGKIEKSDEKGKKRANEHESERTLNTNADNERRSFWTSLLQAREQNRRERSCVAAPYRLMLSRDSASIAFLFLFYRRKGSINEVRESKFNVLMVTTITESSYRKKERVFIVYTMTFYFFVCLKSGRSC